MTNDPNASDDAGPAGPGLGPALPLTPGAPGARPDARPVWVSDDTGPQTGWTLPGQAPVARARTPLTRGGQILRVATWVAGLAGLGFLALGGTRLRSGETSSAYAVGYTLGGLGVALAIGAGVKVLLDRARASSGHPPLSWAWAMPVAAAVLSFQLVTPGSGSGSVPRASNPPASEYVRIAAPYTLVPPTSEDGDLVAKLQAVVGQHGFTDVRAVRILDTDRTLAGYLLVISGDDFSGDLDQAMAGMLDSINKRSISPAITSIDGRSVVLYPANGVWNASWFDGHISATVVAADKESVGTLAKAVLDSR